MNTNARYPVGLTLIGTTAEIDTDHNGNERTTPAGSEWLVTEVDGELRHLVCEATGAWIAPSVDEVARGFRAA